MGVDITRSRMGLEPLRKMSFEKQNLLLLRRVLKLLATLNMIIGEINIITITNIIISAQRTTF